jgi:hypothetical protein
VIPRYLDRGGKVFVYTLRTAEMAIH